MAGRGTRRSHQHILQAGGGEQGGPRDQQMVRRPSLHLRARRAAEGAGANEWLISS